MTTLRGPDPYGLAEERLTTLRVGQSRRERDAEYCRLLHETIPTYDHVAIYRPSNAGLRLAAWAGAIPPPRQLHRVPGHEPTLQNDVAAETTPAIWPGATRAEVLLPFVTPAGMAALLVASAHRGAFGPADFALLRLVIASLRESGG